IDLFIQAIEMNPAVVSLKGYADVNRELLSSSVTTIAIYLIVLLQFKLSLIQQQTTNNSLGTLPATTTALPSKP
ncbi:Gustatory and odorant receptor 22, partial [Pseudolycoriella hygida]